MTTPKLVLTLLTLCATTAVMLLGFWVALQRLAPLIAETAGALSQVPNLFAILFVGVAVTYILRGLFE